MILKSFSAENFRNIKQARIEFSPGVNLLLGDNAEGKTNALEGIYIFARGKSFRRTEDKSLIKLGEEGFNIGIEYSDKNGDGCLEYSLYGKQRLRKKNKYKINSVSEMLGSFRAVLFYPDDLALVKGGPEERREFLNVAISQIYPEYIDEYRQFKNALDNRNSLLKSAVAGKYYDKGELYSWGDVLAVYSERIYKYRKEYIKKLEYYAKEAILDISEGSELLTFEYKSNIEEGESNISEAYKSIYSSYIERECAAGVSLHGPQRDDIIIKINGSEARSFSSQGQQRSIVLAMKLAEGEVIREICKEYPVYLFDDVLSELDTARQSYVLKSRADKQIIISSCRGHEGIIIPDKVIKVEGGKYS